MGKKIKTWSVTDLVVMTLRASEGNERAALERFQIYCALSGLKFL